MALTARIVGPGRAGGAFASALATAGYVIAGSVGSADDPAGAAADVDLVLVATPDALVADVAARIEPSPDTLVCHVAGSLGPDVLADHPRRAVLHPLVSLPDAERGARALRGAWFGVAGDRGVFDVVAALGGRAVEIADEHRASYHAAAAIASNHLVALLADVERVASDAGAPLEAYLDLVRATIENVAASGPAAALTGPASRGDWATIAAHRAALPSELLASYDVMAQAAHRLAGSPAGNPPGGAPWT